MAERKPCPGQLRDIFDYKNQLMTDLINNARIVELLSNGDSKFSDPKRLAYTQIFPYEYIPETAQEGLTYICYDVDITKAFNKTFLQPSIKVWIFCHKSQLRLKEGGVRLDELVMEIGEMLNGNKNYSIGELELYSVTRFVPMAAFQGKQMVFDGREFNRPRNLQKSAPNNRKTG